MGQLYLQKFEFRGAIDKDAYDAAWGVANATMAKTGNYGGVAQGLTHIHGYGTAAGGYVLLEVDDPAALTEYQLFHVNNYSHIMTTTFEPLVDLDAALAPLLAELRGEG
jgi:hypothetical protein